MSRIVQAANAMIDKKDKISNIRRVVDVVGDATFLFVFNNKYLWAVRGGNWLGFVEDGPSALDAAVEHFENPSRGRVKVLGYDTSDWEFNTAEAKKTFAALQRIVQERASGVDRVLDDIIDTGDYPF